MVQEECDSAVWTARQGHVGGAELARAWSWRLFYQLHQQQHWCSSFEAKHPEQVYLLSPKHQNQSRLTQHCADLHVVQLWNHFHLRTDSLDDSRDACLVIILIMAVQEQFSSMQLLHFQRRSSVLRLKAAKRSALRFWRTFSLNPTQIFSFHQIICLRVQEGQIKRRCGNTHSPLSR